MTTSTISQSLGSGLAGAVSLTLLHETARRFLPEAPRADILGERGIVQLFRRVNTQPPAAEQLYPMSIVGELVANTLYYSLVGTAGKQPLLAGVAFGALAGVGAVMLPGPMGLGEKPTTRTPLTTAMTVGWYLFGGMVAGMVYSRTKEQTAI